MATEDGRAINTTAEHPYLAKLYEQELCDKYSGNVWNKEADEFNNYCTRWVEVRDLEEGNYIAVPITEISQNYFDFADSNCISSSATSSSSNPLSRIFTTNAPKCPPMPSTSLKSSPSVYFLVTNSFANLPKSFPISAINNPISPIVSNSENDNYLKLSDIKFVKISSIKQLDPQHVYDLSIEGTRNFIANEIVAHKAYLATSSGNLGIRATSPASKLEVAGTANLTQGTTFFRVTSDNNIAIRLE